MPSKYWRYKAGSAKLVKWLFESASKASESPQAQHKCIRADDLVIFAKLIVASTEPQIDIPFEILDITQDVILGRQACLEWYQELSKSNDDATLLSSNAGHAYFLKTLREVFEILRVEHRMRRPRRKRAMPQMSSDMKDLTNLYRQLELQEPVMMVNDAPAAAMKSSIPRRPTSLKPDDARPSNSTSDYLLDTGAEQMSFAVFAMLKDLQEVRAYVKDVWRRYTAGKISFLSAARICDYAFHVCEIVIADIREDHAELVDFEAMLSRIALPLLQPRATHVNGTRHDRNEQDNADNKSDLHSDATAERADELLCLDAFTGLYHLRDVHAFYWHVQDTKQWDTLRPTGQMPLPQHPFAHVLIALFRDIQDLLLRSSRKGHNSDIALCNIYSTIDRYTRGLFELARNGTISTFLVYSTTIYMDIYDALEGDMGRGVREALATISRVQTTINEFDDFISNTHPLISMHLTLGGDYQRSRRLYDITPAQAHNGRECWIAKSNKPDWPDVMLPLDLLAGLPLLPALLAHRNLEALQSYGSCLHNTNQNLLCSAHLYRAASALGALQTDWIDMDHIVATQQTRGPFVRAGDLNIISIAKQYSMSLGLSLNTVSRKRGLEPHIPSPIATFRKANKFRPVMDLQYASQNAQNQNISLGFSLTYGSEIYYTAIKSFIAAGGMIQDPKIAEQWENAGLLAPVQLLTVLNDVILAEEQQLNFNHVGFIADCVCILEMAVLRPFAKRLLHSRRTEMSGIMLFEMVHTILWEAAAAEMNGQPKTTTMLWKTGRLMEKELTREADRFTSTSLNHCSHHLTAPAVPTQCDRHLYQTVQKLPRLSDTTLREILSAVNRLHCDPKEYTLRLMHLRYTRNMNKGLAHAEAVRNVSEVLKTHLQGKATITWKQSGFQVDTSEWDAYIEGRHGEDLKRRAIEPRNLERLLKETIPFLSGYEDVAVSD